MERTLRKTVISACINGVLCLAGTLCIAIVIEVTLRIAGYEGDQERLGSVFDPDYGHVDKESWIFDLNITRNEAVSINNQIVSREKSPSEIRFLFIGDSGTAGSGVDPSDTFPYQFTKLLHSRFPTTNLVGINAGVVGMTTIDEYHLLKDQLVHLDPDYVVLGLFMANDITFNLGHQERRRADENSGTVQTFLRSLRHKSALMHFIYLRTLVLNSRWRLTRIFEIEDSEFVPIEMRAFDEDNFHMFNYLHGEIATYKKKHSPLVKKAFKTLEQVLYQFKVMALEKDFVFRVVLFPTSSTLAGRLEMFLYPNAIDDLRAEDISIAEDDLDFMKPTKKVLEICRRLKIVCIDPTHQMKLIGTKAVIPGDDHPSVQGHAVVTEVLLNHFETLGFTR